MALNKISINNFTVFDEIEIDFCGGINVFIGENGTGKTHMLKILYALCEWGFSESTKWEDPTIVKKLWDCFQYVSLHELSHNSCEDPIEIVSLMDGQEKTYTIWNFSKQNTNSDCRASGINKTPYPYVFIPAKEMLTHAVLEKDYAERNLPFDITIIDILNKAGVSTKRIIPDDMRIILEKIAQIIGGKVVYKNDRYYIEKPNGTLNSFAVEAEGFKKLGLIYRLIETGYLVKDSMLIWDEPEANLNPKLIPTLVDIILALEQTGVQMFFATHDYFFAKFLETRKKKDNKVVYHALYKESHKVLCESQNDFELLENNSIIAQSIELYKEEVRKVME